MEPLPDFGALTDDELKALIDELEQQEREVSYQRRLLHGKIDILRAELVARLQKSGGQRSRPGRRRPADADPDREGGAAGVKLATSDTRLGRQVRSVQEPPP